MRRVAVICFVVVCALAVMAPAMVSSSAATRIKDVAKVQGVRSNQLVGFGLVVGLNGTGDSSKSLQTMQSMSSMLQTFGVTVTSAQMQSKNVAAVIVTAQLPPFVKSGDTIDITIASTGDAKNLQGGMLLQTPLRAANGQVYAVGQGAVSTGGASSGSNQSKNFPTVGMTPNGAIVERDVITQLVTNGTITLSLNQPDFTTANRISAAVGRRFGDKIVARDPGKVTGDMPSNLPNMPSDTPILVAVAVARDPGTIVVNIPREYENDIVGFLAIIEELSIQPDSIAKIIINERTGTIIMGSNVSIDEVAISQGGLSIRIGKPQDPGTASGDGKEDRENVMRLPASTSVQDVVKALNAIGATPRDIISILQAMKAAGALHAELQII